MSLLQIFLALIVLALIAGLVVIVRAFAGSSDNGSERLEELERRIDSRLAGIEELEQRIAVLEKIVTERRYELDEQFRDLNKTG